jgi:hypothetical protein
MISRELDPPAELAGGGAVREVKVVFLLLTLVVEYF